MKRLSQHVRLLEGQIMAVGNVPPADLDTFTKDQRALAATMESGWDAADALLTSTRRTYHQNRVQRFHDAQARHQATGRKQLLWSARCSPPHTTPSPTPRPPPSCAPSSRARPPSSRASPGRLPRHVRPLRPLPRTGQPPRTNSRPSPPANERNSASAWRCAANWPTPSATACSCPPGSPPSSGRPHQHEIPNAGSSARPEFCSTASPTRLTTKSSPSAPAPTPKTNTNISGGRN